MLYNLDNKTGKLKEFDPPFVATEPGAGPRHIRYSSKRKSMHTLMEELTGSGICL